MIFKCTKAFLIILLVLLTLPIRGWAGLAITPAYVDVILDKGRPSGQFLISNLGEEEERFRINAAHFAFLKEGGVRRIEADKNSLAPWIKFNPKEFVLGPMKERLIRFVIVPPKNLSTGEYWAAMELESLKTVIQKMKDEEGRNYQIEVIPSIMVPIFGKWGNIRYRGNLKETKVSLDEKGQSIQVLVENTGEGRLWVEGNYRIINSSGEEVEKGSIGQGYLLPGLELAFSTTLKSDFPEGNYTVRVQCRSPQLKKPIANEIQLMWKPPVKF